MRGRARDRVEGRARGRKHHERASELDRERRREGRGEGMLPCGDLVRSKHLESWPPRARHLASALLPITMCAQRNTQEELALLPSSRSLAIHSRVSDLASASPRICSAKVASRRRQSQWVRARAYVRGRLPLFALREPSEARRGEGEWGQLLRHAVVPRSLAHSPTRSTANFSSGGD